MPFTAIADPQQRAILTAVLDDVCMAAGIDRDGLERDEAANLVMQFYGKGNRTADQLLAAFHQAMRAERFG